MSVNIRNYVSNDHIESIGEIAKSQSAIIQALSIDNSKLQRELQRKDNIINELKKWLEEQHQFIIEIPAFTKEISQEHKVMECCYEDVLDKIKELEGDNM